MARVSFNITTRTDYTGIFESGCDSAILRFSAAQKPDPADKVGGLAPGIGIKFLRDGVPSSNIVSMVHYPDLQI